ncbi:hypothetical protein CDAR_529401 [Caerostris darwini]|uniref:Uncharacterized protein n=1 Tax=Caerostris darwini TaxID=1538125 RepID=A0AAV4M9J6_9ARAC|nr:hypothetical protein CDAR_529401 [Caerostris darwini]
MERDATMDYSVRESASEESNPELMDTTCAAIQSERLSSPTFPEKQSNLSDEEHCARISTVIKKKDIAQNLYDAYAAALTGYSTDDDDIKKIKILYDDLQHAMREPAKSYLPGTGVIPDQEGGSPEQRPIIALRWADVRHIRKLRLLGVHNFW